MSISDEAEALVAGATEMAHLATSVDDRPHVAPVWYHYEDGHVYVFTGGRKLANVRRNPRVAVSIEASEDSDAQWTVTMQGTATVVEDEDRVLDWVRPVFGKYLGADVETWSDYHRESLEEGPDTTLLDIEVGSATHTTY